MSQKNNSTKNKQQPKNAKTTAAVEKSATPAQKNDAKSKQSSAAANTPLTSMAASSTASGGSNAVSSTAAVLPANSSSASTSKAVAATGTSVGVQQQTKSASDKLTSPPSSKQSSGSSVPTSPPQVNSCAPPAPAAGSTGEQAVEQIVEQTVEQTAEQRTDTVIVRGVGAMGANESSSISKESSVDPNKKHTDDVTSSDVKPVGEISNEGSSCREGSSSSSTVTGLSSTSESNKQCNENKSEAMKDGRAGTSSTPSTCDLSQRSANDAPPNKLSNDIQAKDDAGKILTDVMTPANEIKTGSDTDTEANIADTKRIVEEFRKAVIDDLVKFGKDKLTNKDVKPYALSKAANIKLDKSGGVVTSDQTSSSKDVSSVDTTAQLATTHDPRTLVESATRASSSKSLQDEPGKVDQASGGKELIRVNGEVKTCAAGDVDDDLEVTDIMKRADRQNNTGGDTAVLVPASDVTSMTTQTELIMKKTFTESVQPNQEFVPIRDDVTTTRDDVTASTSADVIDEHKPIIAGNIATSEEVALGSEVEVAAKGRILSDALTQAQDLKSDLKRLQNLLDDLSHFETVVHTSEPYEIASHKPVIRRRRPKSTIEGEELGAKVGGEQGGELTTKIEDTPKEQASTGEEGSNNGDKHIEVQSKEVQSGVTQENSEVSPEKSGVTLEKSVMSTDAMLSKEVLENSEPSIDTNIKCADNKPSPESQVPSSDVSKNDASNNVVSTKDVSQPLQESTNCNGGEAVIIAGEKSVAQAEEKNTTSQNVKTASKCDGDPLSLL